MSLLVISAFSENSKINLYVEEKSSFKNLFLFACNCFRNLFIKKEKKYIIPLKFLPLNRYEKIFRLNLNLHLFIVRTILRRNSMIETLIITEPEYFFLHNFLKWRYLIFTYEPNSIFLLNTFYWENIYKKQNVYIYKRSTEVNLEVKICNKKYFRKEFNHSI